MRGPLEISQAHKGWESLGIDFGSTVYIPSFSNLCNALMGSMSKALVDEFSI